MLPVAYNFFMQEIQIGGKTIAYAVKVSRRARNVRVTVRADGSVALTVPAGISERFATRFLMRKSQWVLRNVERFKKNPAPVSPKGGKREYAAHKERARAFAHERLAYFNRYYGLTFNAVSIRNQKTRWGSCSRRGNLNFNYKIALLSPHLADYIIVHELCHLKELNHSERFWDLVALTVPDHRSRRTELRKGGGYV